MNKENESSGAILVDISSFYPVGGKTSYNGGSSGLGKFIQRLEMQLTSNTEQFQLEIDRINRGVLGSSKNGNEKILIDKIHSLEQRIEALEDDNHQLQEALNSAENENKLLEKKLALFSAENSRSKQSKISSLNSRRSPNRTSQPPTVDIDKYRRALLYIDELQHRLRPN